MMHYIYCWLHADWPFIELHLFALATTLLTVFMLYQWWKAMKLYEQKKSNCPHILGSLTCLTMLILAITLWYYCSKLELNGDTFFSMKWALFIAFAYIALAAMSLIMFNSPKDERGYTPLRHTLLCIAFMFILPYVFLTLCWVSETPSHNDEFRADAEYNALSQEEKNKRFDEHKLKFFLDTEWPEWDVVSGRKDDVKIRFRTPLPESILKELDKKCKNSYFWEKDTWDDYNIITYYFHNAGDDSYSARDYSIRINTEENTLIAGENACPYRETSGEDG